MTTDQLLMMGVGSALVVLQRAKNPYYARALRRNKNFDQAVELRAEAIRARDDLAKSRPQPPLMPTTVDDDLDAWHTARAAWRADEQRWAARQEDLDLLIAEQEQRIQGVGLNRSGIVASLQADLDDLMTQVTEAVTKLGGATTPTQVIAAGTGEAWNELAGLRERFDTLRAGYEAAMSGAEELGWARSRYLISDPWASDAMFENISEVFPSWREPDKAYRQVGMDPSATVRPQPWPEDKTAALAWIVNSGALPWAPTPEQLNQLWARRRAESPETDGLKRMEIANA